MKGKAIIYSKDELAWIKSHCTLPRKKAHAKFCQVFKRHDVTKDNIKSLCSRKGWSTGRTGYFPKNHVPANKGKKMPYNANRARTQFKKGRTPHNTKYAGHERITRDGYIELSINEKDPHTGFERRYVLKHKYLWEKAHGTVPEGMCLKCIDSNRQNTDPSNWELIPRGALPFLNGHRGHNYDHAPGEVKPTIMTLAKLKYARKERCKK